MIAIRTSRLLIAILLLAVAVLIGLAAWVTPPDEPTPEQMRARQVTAGQAWFKQVVGISDHAPSRRIDECATELNTSDKIVSRKLAGRHVTLPCRITLSADNFKVGDGYPSVGFFLYYTAAAGAFAPTPKEGELLYTEATLVNLRLTTSEDFARRPDWKGSVADTIAGWDATSKAVVEDVIESNADGTATVVRSGTGPDDLEIRVNGYQDYYGYSPRIRCWNNTDLREYLTVPAPRNRMVTKDDPQPPPPVVCSLGYWLSADVGVGVQLSYARHFIHALPQSLRALDSKLAEFGFSAAPTR